MIRPTIWRLRLAGILLVLFYAVPAASDAIVRSQAMFADTIAEFYIEDEQVRLELEIGANDIGAFRNLLPDNIYQELGYGDRPLQERLLEFVTEDMPVFAGENRLAGQITSIGPATRPLRDNITGEALPTPDDQAVAVIRATIVYPFDQAPDSVTLVAPRKTGAANIGFVLYHKGVAVNDYRYLTSGQTVNLDWQDTWYSAFSERGLRRQYYSPMTGFIYVEPYEVRKEIIVRPADIQQYVDLGLEGETMIPADRQQEIIDKVVEFLADHFPVKIDGEPVEGQIDRVNFLKRTLRSSVVVNNQDLELLPATLGVIYVFPTDGLPQNVEMEWDLFNEKTPTIPASTVDQAGPLPIILEPDFNVLRWENFLRFPELPALNDIEKPPTVLQRIAGWARWVLLALSVLLLAWLLRAFVANRSLSRPLASASLLLLVLTGLVFYQQRQVAMDEERLTQLVGDLLHNVYRAFDYRGEEVIYGVLEKSVSGELLTDIYLETQKGLELANQGGARVKVKTTEVTDAELVGRDGNRLTIASDWNVSGSVGHWGHIHQRKNGYRANLEISEIEGAWKLTGLEILEEQRL
ncbi:MAG: hypothetical protein ACR2QV_15290 [Gammaproteobacteria bacterium]